MLKYHERERKKAVADLVSKRKKAAINYLSKNSRRIASICLLFISCTVALTIVIPGINFEQFMSFSKVSPQKLDRLSDDAFRKIIGYGYEEKIYISDTAEIRARLEADSMIFGKVHFLIGFIPYELEIKFREASPLFALMPQRSDSTPLIYSDNGKIYPYSTNIAELPVVDAKSSEDISLATDFLIDMRKNDPLLYSRISQLIPGKAERQVAVFFNDVDFKTIFSLERDYWKTAFRHYRQLTGNMQVLNISSVAVLDLRFRQFAYTTKKDWRL
ncbi:MAG: hypothetical protein LBB36_03140 [Fibromonadaceae bacterium]|jgi:hypothetical protein|nr:hypothetical protein [Fibromonadaceae bacterium]